MKEIDRMMLEDLNSRCETSIQTDRPITLQAILTKADLLSGSSRQDIQKLQREIFEAAPLCLPAIITASSKTFEHGVPEVRRSILEACGIGRIAGKVIHS